MYASRLLALLSLRTAAGPALQILKWSASAVECGQMSYTLPATNWLLSLGKHDAILSRSLFIQLAIQLMLTNGECWSHPSTRRRQRAHAHLVISMPQVWAPLSILINVRQPSDTRRRLLCPLVQARGYPRWTIHFARDYQVVISRDGIVIRSILITTVYRTYAVFQDTRKKLHSSVECSEDAVDIYNDDANKFRDGNTDFLHLLCAAKHLKATEKHFVGINYQLQFYTRK